jgi:hypothetical protein
MPKQLVMDHSGHSEHVFDQANVVSAQEAEKRFAELTGQGFTAAAIRPGGKSEIIRKFDASVEETLFIPRYIGG